MTIINATKVVLWFIVFATSFSPFIFLPSVVFPRSLLKETGQAQGQRARARSDRQRLMIRDRKTEALSPFIILYDSNRPMDHL